LNAETHLLDACVEGLRQHPGIQADVVHEGTVAKDRGVDAWLRLCSPLDRVEYACEIKQKISQSLLGYVINQLHQLREKTSLRPLLISDYLTSNVSDRLMQEGFEFIDIAGNMYLNSPAAYILIRGKRPLDSPKAAKSVLTATSLKLIYALLNDPRILDENDRALDKNYRELAQIAGISLGAVSSAIQHLYESGYLQRKRGGGYQLDDYSKLCSIWELGYMEKLRPKLFAGTFTMTGYADFTKISEKLKVKAEKEGYLIGGELGAAIATRYLRPQRATLHISGNIRELIMALHLKPEVGGEITLLNQFGTWNPWWERDKTLASPLLLHAELLVEHDDRLREAATLLLEKYLPGKGADALYS
jgi:hypothetical protein